MNRDSIREFIIYVDDPRRRRTLVPRAAPHGRPR
jgi:hypothetical protein